MKVTCGPFRVRNIARNSTTDHPVYHFDAQNKQQSALKYGLAVIATSIVQHTPEKSHSLWRDWPPFTAGYAFGRWFQGLFIRTWDVFLARGNFDAGEQKHVLVVGKWDLGYKAKESCVLSLGFPVCSNISCLYSPTLDREHLAIERMPYDPQPPLPQSRWLFGM